MSAHRSDVQKFIKNVKSFYYSTLSRNVVGNILLLSLYLRHVLIDENHTSRVVNEKFPEVKSKRITQQKLRRHYEMAVVFQFQKTIF